jgi:minimal PKS acyl carrier protein
MAEFTLHDLKGILRSAAGEADYAGPGDDMGDLTFEDLGYDSVALLEAGNLIQREYGIRLSDEVVADTSTPNALVEVVNSELIGASDAGRK